MRSPVIIKQDEDAVYSELELRCLPLIKHHVGDLTKIDRQILKDNEGVPFIHFTRECGTYITLFSAPELYPAAGERVKYLFGTANREHLLNEKMSLVKHYEQPSTDAPLLITYFDGKKLSAIDLKKARQLVLDYQRNVRSAWSQPKR